MKPKVEPKDYQGLALKKARWPSTDDARSTSSWSRCARPGAGSSRSRAATWPRPVTSPSSTTTATVDGKPFPGSKAEDVTVEVAARRAGRVATSPQLEGVKVGEAKELDYAFPADYRVEEVKGKTAAFNVTLKGLKKQVVPELNDDFAKEIGGGADAGGAQGQGPHGPREVARRRSGRRTSARS